MKKIGFYLSILTFSIVTIIHNEEVIGKNNETTSTALVTEQQKNKSYYSLHNTALNQLPNLSDSIAYTHIDLSHSKIKTEYLDWYNLLQKDANGNYLPSEITHINLSNCMLSNASITFPIELFPKLKVLDLSHNSIRFFVIKGDHKMQRLDVSNNQLEIAYINQAMDTLQLSNNPKLTGNQLVWQDKISNIVFDRSNGEQPKWVGGKAQTETTANTNKKDKNYFIQYYVKEAALGHLESTRVEADALRLLSHEQLIQLLNINGIGYDTTKTHQTADGLLDLYQVILIETPGGIPVYYNYLQYNDTLLELPIGFRFHEIQDIISLPDNKYLIIHKNIGMGSAGFLYEIAYADLFSCANGTLQIDTIHYESPAHLSNLGDHPGINFTSSSLSTELSYRIGVTLHFNQEKMQLEYAYTTNNWSIFGNSGGEDTIWDIAGKFDYIKGTFTNQQVEYKTNP